MDLNGFVSGAIGVVNPYVRGVVFISNGYTTNPDGKRVPVYFPGVTAMMQVQPLMFRDITQLDGLTLQGTRTAIYIEGSIEGLNRASQKGGDMISFPDGTTYLVALVLEAWPEWTKVAATLQTPTNSPNNNP